MPKPGHTDLPGPVSRFTVEPLALARRLLAFDTINPPGGESAAARYLEELLGSAGFAVRSFEFAPGRTSLLATLAGPGAEAPVGFTGHLDTVPLGSVPWSHDPFGGEVEGDRLYGRGASDMKGAVAAIFSMAMRHAGTPGARAITLILTAGEETGCEGARHLASAIELEGAVGALVVGEPTENHPVIAHKGCVRYRIATRGVSAHGSMPEQGVNAIHGIAEAVQRLREFDFETPAHPLLGTPTLNIGTIRGGSGVNLVADAAEIEVDIRLVPGLDASRVESKLSAALGPEVRIERLQEAASVATDPDDPWVQQVFEVMTGWLGERPGPAGVPYFTDASVLTAALGHPPTVILGPGKAALAHTTDEYCRVSLLESAAEAYLELARRGSGR
jgi:succinyl-diaminopimelate desuccinylase